MGTLNPVWREIHEFQINWPRDEIESAPTVKIEVWDWDGVSADEFLGEISFPLPTGDGENLIDMEVQPNRSKGQNSVRGHIQARVYFKNQFVRDENEGVLHPYEKAFCEYFGDRVVDEQLARTIAPPLIFFHLSSRRLLFSQLRDAWRNATFDLVASKAARGPKLRSHCYLELVSALCFAIGLASGALLAQWAITNKEPSALSTALVACTSATIAPDNLSGVMADFLWHRTEPPALVGRMGLGGRGWGVPAPFSHVALFISLLGSAAFCGFADQKAVDNQWVIGACICSLRLVVFPLSRGLRLTWLLLSARGSHMHDWYLRLWPSVMTAHGALLQRLPWRHLILPA